MRLDQPISSRESEPADVSAWLLTLRKLLRLPEEEAAAILDELEDHLQQRVRDLQVGGMSDAEAVRTALNELGDAAALARRFKSVSGYRKRRTVMNLAILGLACGASVLSMVAIGQNVGAIGERNVPIRAYMDQPADDPKLAFAGSGEVQLGALVEQLGKKLEMPVHVRWGRLEEHEITKATPVVVVGRDLDLSQTFQRINESPAVADALKLDYRTTSGVLEIADREFFDRRERVLASYDLSDLLEGQTLDVREKIKDDLRGVITHFVSADDWQDNGGDLASLSMVDARLFVDAPPRMHRQVAWILGELRSGSAGAASVKDNTSPSERTGVPLVDVPAVRPSWSSPTVETDRPPQPER